MNDLFSVKDKVVLITGGCGGIGRELVNGFIDAEAKVACFDKVSPTEDIVNDDCHYWNEDLTMFLDSVFSSFLKHFGRIDVLINCHGITRPSPDLNYPNQFWNETITTNLSVVFCLCKLAGLQMIEQKNGGSIINFTSINAQQAMPDNPAYAAAKAGVRSLTRALAYDWGKYGIRVNNLGPGYTRTSMNKKSLNNPKACKLRADSTMLGRWANPNEMVGPAIFLASEASSYVTGMDLWVDGGWLAKGILK